MDDNEYGEVEQYDNKFDEYSEAEEVDKALIVLTQVMGISDFGNCRLDFNYDNEYPEYYLTAEMDGTFEGTSDSCVITLFVQDDTAVDAKYVIESVVPLMIQWVKEYRKEHNDAPIFPWIVIDEFPYSLKFVGDDLHPEMVKNK